MDEEKLIYPKLSYKIVGILFDVFKNLGPNYREKYYKNAIEEGLKLNKIKYYREYPIKLFYKDKQIGINFLDFLIDDKLILEVKIGKYFRKDNLVQVLNYLKATGLKLGIIANFTNDGVKQYRVLNIY